MIGKLTTTLRKTVALGALVALAPVAAQAGIIGNELDGQIDFRTTDYSACANTPSCTVGNLTIDASNNQGSADIFWDSLDGLGVLGGQENDEIDGSNMELLTLTFDTPQTVLGVWFTDLFNLGADPVEIASVRLTTAMGDFFDFTIEGVDPNGASNGEVYLDFGGAFSVTEILFGSAIDIDDDHSVAGIVTGNSVPEPAFGFLFGIGVLGLVLRNRKHATASSKQRAS